MDVGPAHVGTSMEYVVGANKHEYGIRKLKDSEKIYVNETCECGSCPILMAQNNKGSWRRLRDIMPYNAGPEQAGAFQYEVPPSAKAINIVETKSEVSYFSDLAVNVVVGGRIMATKSVGHPGLVATYSSPIVVDLAWVQKDYAKADYSLLLSGAGYYVSRVREICPPVPVLDTSLF